MEVTVPSALCVVTTESVPQVDELQPRPDSDHVRAVFGFEPGTGVIVATSVAVPPAGTLWGAATCSVKLPVMVIGTDACFEGSATLCAVKVVLAGFGKTPGAVKFPARSTLPHVAGQVGPVRLQRIEVSG